MARIDIDELREELGLGEDCEKCKQKEKECKNLRCFPMMHFCDSFDIAVTTILERHEKMETDGRLYTEQEAVKIKTKNYDGFGNKISLCPSCNATIRYDYDKCYCGFCGKKVEWDV